MYSNNKHLLFIVICEAPLLSHIVFTFTRWKWSSEKHWCMSVLKVYESKREEQRKKKASRGHTEAVAAVWLVEAVISDKRRKEHWEAVWIWLIESVATFIWYLSCCPLRQSESACFWNFQVLFPVRMLQYLVDLWYILQNYSKVCSKYCQLKFKEDLSICLFWLT